jgi:ribonuclease HI
MKELTIYTDGSCLKNPDGPGGWAYAIIDTENDKIVHFCYGGEKCTTNNRMEMLAVINVLKNRPDASVYNINTDSQLVIKCAKGQWKRKANTDLWNLYDVVSKGKTISYTWVRGHSGNKYNHFVDTLARDYAKQFEHDENRK